MFLNHLALKKTDRATPPVIGGQELSLLLSLNKIRSQKTYIEQLNKTQLIHMQDSEDKVLDQRL
jgi:hypothetical protein